MIRFIIPGTPVSKARPRLTRYGTAYNTAATSAYESKVAVEALVAFKNAKMKQTDAPVRVEIALVFPVPESWTKKKKASALMGCLYPKSVDVDNVAKAILDGLNGVAYSDDTQVIDLRVTKHYGQNPRAVVSIEQISPSVPVEIAA